MISFEVLNLCLSETLESFIMKILFYTGMFNVVIVVLVFIINGKVSLELINKMRKLIVYAFVTFSIPFISALIKYYKISQ